MPKTAKMQATLRVKSQNLTRARHTVFLICLGLSLCALAGCLTQSASEPKRATLKYPETRRGEHLDHYHGTTVADPYRWLEDDRSPETKAWVEAQNAVTGAYLAGIPERDKIRQRLTTLWDYERYGVPFRRGDTYFLSRNNGLQNQSVLYTLDTLTGTPQELLDPNTLSKEGTVALNGYQVSKDGKFLAYALSSAGSDWQEWRVRDVAQRKDLNDHLRWSKFSGASWSADGQGFYYSRYDEPKAEAVMTGLNYFQKLYYHKLGTAQSEDFLVYERPDHKEWGFDAHVSEDGHYLFITVWRGAASENGLLYKDLRDPQARVTELLTAFDANYEFVGSDGSTLFVRTDLNAPRGRLIAIDLAKPQTTHWQEIIPQETNRLESVAYLNRQFVAGFLEDAQSMVKIVEQDGRFVRKLEFPGLGTVSGFSGESDHSETFYAFTSFNTPTIIYRYDFPKSEATVFRRPQLKFEPAAFETKQVFYRSKDGTRVPMFITHRRGLKLDGKRATYLYGYGGFDSTLSPQFSPATLVWMEMGGIYAQPSLRGGGEYGEEWHKAGMKDKKQNVFDDFIAAAEYLIAHGYTRPDKLAIGGGSNGGLLVGAAITQRPELFGAALPAVGVMDMLRFHKFTIGWGWANEYGSSDSPEAFRYLYAYSPLHRLKPGTEYPATLITTADHDDRVVPAHSFKFAATMQECQAGQAPVLIRIETSAGHGAGKPTSKRIEEAADRWAFLVHELGM